jgi:molybdopterin converting factor small subunit
MALVILRAPLSELAGGRRHAVAGDTVGEALAALERTLPQLRGWVLDEQGRSRRHVNVYVNGQLAQDGTTLAPDDRVHVLPAITGG